jgi:hypothetical protein
MRKIIILLFTCAICGLLLGMLAYGTKAGDDVWTTSGPYGVSIWSLVSDPNNRQIMYAGGDRGVYKSTDGGSTWVTSSSAPGGGTSYGIAINPQNSQVIYVGTTSGVYSSTNSGGSWALTGLHEMSMALAMDPANPQILYAGYAAAQRPGVIDRPHPSAGGLPPFI